MSYTDTLVSILRKISVVLTAFIIIAIFVENGILKGSVSKDAVAQRIIDVLGSGNIVDVKDWLNSNPLADPIVGTLILFFIFGMLISLSLKMNQPIPVWMVAFLVVIIAMIAGMGSWAIPITLIYISEALTAGMAIHSAFVVFLILVGSAVVIGFGIQWYITFFSEIIRKLFAGNTVNSTVNFPKHKRRR